ncbi:archease [Streptomyces sp. NBC_01803]|uniref:archease n=1 Tax=Streptomyces sp. NBC_01803 TaxID=2975946 RepID=UPI002DD9F3FF|nr:archease [Streptomyces sp. NBC_01803]WSA46152.1 archease [Streptomyces sp. NBC_01803]
MEERRAGHRGVPHTADLRVEAWAPTREECLAEAVRGVVEAFVDVTGVVDGDAGGGGQPWETVVRADDDEDLLTGLMDELVYRLDTAGEVPLDVRAEAVPGGVRAVWRTADVGALPLVGAVPKAVTLHGLAFGPGPDGWRCSVTLDV